MVLEKFQVTSLLQQCHRAFNLNNERKKQYLRTTIKEVMRSACSESGKKFYDIMNCPSQVALALSIVYLNLHLFRPILEKFSRADFVTKTMGDGSSTCFCYIGVGCYFDQHGGFSAGTVVKNLSANTRDEGFIPGLGRFPGEVKG